MRSLLAGILGTIRRDAWSLTISMCALIVAMAAYVSQPQVIDQTRTVVQRVETPGRVIYMVTEKGCDTRAIGEYVNKVLDSAALSGEAEFDNDATADAHGDAAVAQAGVAKSGNVNLGQQVVQVVVCGQGSIVATNTVTDSEGRSGDAEVENDADVKVVDAPEPTDVDSGVGDSRKDSWQDNEPSAPAVSSSPGVTPSPMPSPTPL